MNCYTAATTPHRYFPYLHYFPCVGSGRYFFVCIPRMATWLHVREVEIYPPCSSGQSALEPSVLLAHNFQSIRKLVVDTLAVTTVAGNPNGMSGSNDGVGTSGRFQSPRGVAASSNGTVILVADLMNKKVRRVELFTRIVTSVAGSSDGMGTSSVFTLPYGVALSPDGASAVVTDIGAHVVRTINLLTGQVATLAGLAAASGSVDGVGTNSRFNQPAHVAVAPDGVFALIPEWGNHVVRRVEISTGAVTTLVGMKGMPGSVDGFGSSASFYIPSGIAISPDGFFALVADISNYVIRKVVISTKSVTTLAGAKSMGGTVDGRGTSGQFNFPNSIAISPDGWFAIVTEANKHTIRFVTVNTGDVSTVAGSLDNTGMADGYGLAAQFYNPEGAAVTGASCSTGSFQVQCGSCSSGTYRTNCTWTSPGLCVACDTCPAGQFRFGCAGTSPGTCACSPSSGAYPVVLRDGPSCLCGRVEVRYNGVWGTVCDDYFDAADAMVVCQQLQMTSGSVTSTITLGVGSIWMDDVGCVGTEAELSSCPSRAWGFHDCSHSEDVSVCCAAISVSQSCEACSSDTYRANCSAVSSGYCRPCSLATCDPGQYRVDCGGLYLGQCALCGTCPNGMYRSGCFGTSPGFCTACLSCPAGKQRKGCFGTNAGTCQDCTTPNTYALVSDASANVLRRFNILTRKVETIAGFPGTPGSVDGFGSNARFSNPVVSAYIPAQRVTKILLTDRSNHVVRSVDLQTGSVTSLAGAKGEMGTSDGFGTNARFNQPFGIVVSPTGDFAYVTEYAGHTVRSIEIKTGAVTLRAGGRGINGSSNGIGTDSRFFNPCGLALVLDKNSDGQHLFLADSSNHQIRRIDVITWETRIFAGSYRGSADGVGTAATFSSPQDVSKQTDGYFLYVADRDNTKVRQIDIRTGLTITLRTGDGLSKPSFISLTSDGFYALVCDDSVSAIKQIDIETGIVTVLTAGNPAGGALQDSMGSILQGITLLPQEPRRIIQIAGSAIDYIFSLKIDFRDGEILDYTLGSSNSKIGEATRTNFSLQDGECIKMIELKVTVDTMNIQGLAFSTSFGRSFSIRGSRYDENGQISIWRSGIRECILGFELEISDSAYLIKNVIKECATCLAGSFISAVVNRSGEVEDICSSCPSGTFSNVSGALKCFSCEAGTFSKMGGTECLECKTKPQGTFSADGSFNSTCIFQEVSRYIQSNESCLWECMDGYYRNADYCFRCAESSTVCDISEYLSKCSNSENVKCKACSNKPPNSVYTKQGYITSNCSWKCAQNYFLANNSCNPCNTNPCPTNTFTLPCTETADRRCPPCSNYKPMNSIYSGVDRAIPETCRWECSSGFFCSNISKYASCYDANSSCSLCSNPVCSGESSNLVACTSSSDAFCTNKFCVGEAKKSYYSTPKNLPIGSPGGECIPCTDVDSANRCEVGFFRKSCAQFEDSECARCTNGPRNCGNLESGCFYNSAGLLDQNCSWNCRQGMHAVGESCVNCPPGTYENTGICFECLAGQYSSSIASVSCQLCSKGKYSTASGVSSESGCKSCEAGKYQDVQGETFCKDCKVNSYSGAIAAISDTVCNPCPTIPVSTTTDGKTGKMYPHDCLCPKRQGNISDYYRFNANSTDCLACPRGLICSGSERIEPVVRDSKWILNSSSGYILVSCPKGYYYKQDSDFFSSFKSLQEFQECKPCSKGFDCANPPCQACDMCSLGKYKGCDGTDDCQACPADTYADSNASLECIRCPLGMSTRGSKGKASIQDCVCSENSYAIENGMDCQLCPPGLKCYGNLKEPDPEPLMVASSLDGHELNSSLYIGVSNWAKETPYWKLIYCPPGYRMLTFPEVEYKDQACVACGRGEDCHPDMTPCNKCSACAKGKYKSDRFQYQTKVPRSYFSLQDAAFVREWLVEPCENCPPDTYRSREGGTERGSCTPCPARSRTLGVSGKTSIYDCVCDSQFYLVNTSDTAFECQVCPKGAVCPGRSRTCALQTSPPSCPCEDSNSSQCDNNVPGSWVLEVVSGRRESSVKKAVLRLSVCPPGFMLFKDDLYPDLDECQKCSSGKYSLLPTKYSINSGNASCLSCPFGAECPGGNEVSAKIGFWRDFGLVNSRLASIYACPPGACDEGNKCLRNRTGIICGYCPPGFALTVTGCSECPKPETVDLARKAVSVLGIIFILVLWTAVSFYKIVNKSFGDKAIDNDPETLPVMFEISSELKSKICMNQLTDLDNVLKDFNICPASKTKMMSVINKQLKLIKDEKPDSILGSSAADIIFPAPAPVVAAAAPGATPGAAASSAALDSTAALDITAAAHHLKMKSTLKVHSFKLESNSNIPVLCQGAVAVSDRFVVLTVPCDLRRGVNNTAPTSAAPEPASAINSAAGSNSDAFDISVLCGGGSGGVTADDTEIDFDHFVIGNKIYISRARFQEALNNSKLEGPCHLLVYPAAGSQKRDIRGQEEGEEEEEEQDKEEDEEEQGGGDQENEESGEQKENGEDVSNSGVSSVWSALDYIVLKADELFLIQYCKIFLTYFQILGAFWTFDVDWPDVLVSTMKWASYIFQFDIFHAPNVSCFWADAPFYLKLTAYTLLPFFACAILYLVPFGVWWYHRNFYHKHFNAKEDSEAHSKKRKERFMDLFWQSTMVLIFFVYPVVSLTVLQAFDCRPGTDTAGRNGLDRLSVNIRESCPDPGSFIRVWAGFFILVYPIGLPVLVFCAMYKLRVQEIAEHAVCSEIIVSMIRECIRDCTTPEYSRLSSFWKSRPPSETQTAGSHPLPEIVSNCIHSFGLNGGFSPSEDEIDAILKDDSKYSTAKNGKRTVTVTATTGFVTESAVQHQQDASSVSCCSRGQSAKTGPSPAGGNLKPDLDTLDSRMQREWNTANLFTGAENGFLPYLTDLQLEVLFWWSQVKIFESRYSSFRDTTLLKQLIPFSTSGTKSEQEKAFFEFEKDSLAKLSKHVQSLQRNESTESVPSLELYKAVVNNGRQLIKNFNVAYESPIWSRAQPKHTSHLQVDERRFKSLYSMSMKEVEEMRFAALSSVGIVFASYKMEFWYWELIEMFRK
jgi:DNA-binding beta-propeller fold protein YncE